MSYQIQVKMAAAPEIGAKYKVDNLELSNKNRIVKSADSNIKVTMVGDLMPAQQPPSLANKVLLMPSSPSNHSIVMDTTGQYHLLVEREQVTFDGNECNKIGTSYSAFNNQPGDACLQPLGSCLDNQISNVHEEDFKRIK